MGSDCFSSWSLHTFTFTYLDMASIFGHVTLTIYTNFCSPFPWRLHMKFGFDRSCGFKDLGQRVNGPVNVYLISEPIISTKPGYK